MTQGPDPSIEQLPDSPPPGEVPTVERTSVPGPLQRLDVRVLDPSTAVRGPAGAHPKSTAYRNGRIVVGPPTGRPPSASWT